MTVERGGSPLPAFVPELIEFCELFVDCGANSESGPSLLPIGCAKRKLPFEISPRRFTIGRIEPQPQENLPCVKCLHLAPIDQQIT